jgi:hypothetical protein
VSNILYSKADEKCRLKYNATNLPIMRYGTHLRADHEIVAIQASFEIHMFGIQNYV